MVYAVFTFKILLFFYISKSFKAVDQ